jgi:hypothetical protein
VLKGTIRAARIAQARNANNIYAVDIGANDSRMRIEGRLRFEDFNLSQADEAFGTLTDFTGSLTTTQAKAIDRRNNVWAATYASSAVTAPGSGVSYTITDLYPVVLTWVGGTLTTPFVEVSTDGGTTWVQKLAGNQAGQLALEPGDRIRFMYSSAPTITKHPLLDSAALQGMKALQSAMGGY